MHANEVLVKAVQEGRLEQVREQISQQPELIGCTTATGVPISLLAAYYRQWEVFDWIMTQRSSPNIYEAAAGGRKDAVEDLLKENPALVNAFAPDGFTPLGLACYFNRPDVARLLLEKGADVNLPADNSARVAPLHSAVAANSTDICRMLLEHGAKVNAVQNSGFTSLHSAAHRGNEEMVRLLLRHGADPAIRTDDGRSALDFAQADGHKDIAALLN